MDITRLFLTTILQRKAWVVWALLLALLPFVLPQITPIEQDPLLLEPARAQTAWTLCWLAILTWGLFLSSSFGENLARRGLGEYFTSCGRSRFSQLFFSWLAALLSITPIILLAMIVCLLGAMPANSEEATGWVALNFQTAILMIIVSGSLQILAIGLASRLGSAVSFASTFTLAIHGLYGVGYLKMTFLRQENHILEALWAISPHFHLANLTDRFLFKSGPLHTNDFLLILLYLTALLIIISIVSLGIFNPRQKI